MQQIIGIGEYAISNKINDTIKTFALSSCVALIAYSPMRKALGMVHIALPYIRSDKTGFLPGYYAESGVPMLIDKMRTNYGCFIGELIFHLYGGARLAKNNDVMRIGDSNTFAVKAILKSYYAKLTFEETGGIFSRTVEAEVTTGNVNIIYHKLII